METQENRTAELEMQPVDNVELANVAGGVGPVFDVTKVEGPRLPSWILPVPTQMTTTTIR